MADRIELNGLELQCRRAHMLPSRCAGSPCSGSTCDYCRVSSFIKVPLPAEVYAQSWVSLQHKTSGAKLTFSAVDALALVDATKASVVKVASAGEWQAGRTKETERIEPTRPFDWTYTTHYKGTLEGDWKVETTEERIDMEALKEREKILFFGAAHLFNDDYGDNGEVSLTVKIRAMPSGVFVLQRLVVRVDFVLVRVFDTRVHHKFGTSHLLRETTLREAAASLLERQLGVDPADRGAVAALFKEDKLPGVVQAMPVLEESFEKLSWTS
eukprot:m.197140 g.197140  ORF g.197140 m.197140 type:complete len:270 (-) comp17660_c0_seq1:345-1154(-)